MAPRLWGLRKTSTPGSRGMSAPGLRLRGRGYLGRGYLGLPHGPGGPPSVGGRECHGSARRRSAVRTSKLLDGHNPGRDSLLTGATDPALRRARAPLVTLRLIA